MDNREALLYFPCGIISSCVFCFGVFTYFVLLYPAISPSPDRCGFLLVILLVTSLPFYTSDYDNCRCCVVAKVVASLSLDQRPNPKSKNEYNECADEEKRG